MSLQAIVISLGLACLVLESAQHALQNDATVLARIPENYALWDFLELSRAAVCFQVWVQN